MVFFRKSVQALHFRIEIIESQETEQARNFLSLQRRFVIFFIRPYEREHRSIRCRFPMGFHCRKLGRLINRNIIALVMTKKSDKQSKDKGKRSCEFYGSLK